jgi:hypothetical protein
MHVRWILLALALAGCGTTRTQRRVDGSYTIDCKSQKSCLDRAAKLCGDKGYDIIGGRHDQKLYGVPGNQKLVGKDQLYVRCRSDVMLDAPDPAAGSWKLERSDAGPPPASHNNSRPSPGVCRPGETQRCVGPGACEGGQACKPDSSGYGPCDCGSQNATSGEWSNRDGGAQ